MSLLIVLIGIVLVIGLWFIASYNGFVTLLNRVKEAWADIDVQLKRRFDLIPNLVEVVKGYAAHEKDVFLRVTEARTSMMSAEASGDVAGVARAEGMLAGAMKSLFAVAEDYPELKASVNFLELQRELSDTENKIQAARRFYNATVRDYSIKREMFPGNIIANIFGFGPRDLYDLADSPEQREVVKVDFGQGGVTS